MRKPLFTLALLCSLALHAQTQAPSDMPDAPSTPLTIFPHSQGSRFYASGQANIIFQANTPFHSPYESTNSFVSRGAYKTSLVGTLYLGAQAHHNPRYNTDLLLDFESAGGRGLSQALGLAGFTNLDVVRNPNLGSKPYIARVQIHQTIGLTDKLVDTTRTQFSLATKTPERRIDLRFGKMSLPDVFDINAIGSDSHLQFENWTVDNNGAWDYAADTRGYTFAGVIEYDDRIWSARYAIAAMPTVANGIDLDWAISRASGQNAELELRKGLFSPLLHGEHKGAVRLIGFVNHAHMGTYREANNAFLNGTDKTPDIVAHRHFGAVKYGVGLNLEQELSSNLRAFARFGWNEGQHESFAYTEVDQTISVGADYALTSFSRPNDKLGLAFVSNAIKRYHQTYLKLGGKGFLLGDGNLNYGRENILEAYYNVHTWRGLFFSVGSQGIFTPGYNRDRGPIWVPSVRTHIDF
jgi:high affinity Mn2+ porin